MASGSGVDQAIRGIGSHLVLNYSIESVRKPCPFYKKDRDLRLRIMRRVVEAPGVDLEHVEIGA